MTSLSRHMAQAQFVRCFDPNHDSTMCRDQPFVISSKRRSRFPYPNEMENRHGPRRTDLKEKRKQIQRYQDRR